MSIEQSDIVVGLAFGDEGKGTIVDYLASQKDKVNSVVRFSGGAQAAHNVITANGLHHTFAQLGSASFMGVRTILSRFVLVDVFSLVNEANSFYDQTGFDALNVALLSENALLTTPIHAAINKKREILRGKDAHGSCGMGVGETQSYKNIAGWKAPTLADLNNLPTLFVKLDYLLDYALAEVGEIRDLIPSIDDIKHSYYNLSDDNILNIVSDEIISKELAKGYNIFEGSQGALLDEDLGFHPNTTWSTVTQKNAQTLLEEAKLPKGRTIGVTRSYTTRHGAGAFPSEFEDDSWVTSYPENHNKKEIFQGAWRAGDLDIPLLNYGARANGGVDAVAVTHLDISVNKVAVSYDSFEEVPTGYFDKDRTQQEAFSQTLAIAGTGKHLKSIDGEDELIALIEEACSAPCIIRSYGPTWLDKLPLR